MKGTEKTNVMKKRTKNKTNYLQSSYPLYLLLLSFLTISGFIIIIHQNAGNKATEKATKKDTKKVTKKATEKDTEKDTDKNNKTTDKNDKNTDKKEDTKKKETTIEVKQPIPSSQIPSSSTSQQDIRQTYGSLSPSTTLLNSSSRSEQFRLLWVAIGLFIILPIVISVIKTSYPPLPGSYSGLTNSDSDIQYVGY